MCQLMSKKRGAPLTEMLEISIKKEKPAVFPGKEKMNGGVMIKFLSEHKTIG